MFACSIGFLGVQGSMLAILGLVMLNCALAATLFRRIAGIEMSWGFLLSFVAYVFLIFVHPHFYTIAIWDTFAALSFTLLMFSGWCFLHYSTSPTHYFAPLIVAFVFVFLAFLAKETYGLSALFLTTVWFLVKRQSGALRASLPTIIVATALAVITLSNHLRDSTFTSFKKSPSDNYYVDFTPLSLITEWARYATAGLNVFSLSLLILIAFSMFMFVSKKDYRPWCTLILPVAAVLAWVSHAALPNHYFACYSWQGSYLLFLPILFVVPLWQCGRWARACAIFIIIIAFASPIGLGKKYKQNAWILEQESIQRNLLNAFDQLSDTRPAVGIKQNILITGLNFPFIPYFYIKKLSHLYDAKIDVVTYIPRKYPVRGIRFVSPNEIDLAYYQQVWAFRFDGSLIKNLSDPDHMSYNSDIGLDVSSVKPLIYPKLIDIFNLYINQSESGKQFDGYQYMACGNALLVYKNLSIAEKCLIKSTNLIPENPYPQFYLGYLYEKKGMFDLASISYAKAVSLDNGLQTNPAFKDSLQRVHKNKSQ